MADTRAPSRHTRAHDALTAALTGTEADIQVVLDQMDESELSRLRNTMYSLSQLAESRRKALRRPRGRLL